MIDSSARYQRSLARLTQAGEIATLVDMSTQVAPVVIVGPDGGPYAGGAARYTGGTNNVAGAGVSGTITLLNAAGSGQTYLIEEIYYCCAAAAGVQLVACGVDLISGPFAGISPGSASRALDRREAVLSILNLFVDNAATYGISAFSNLAIPNQMPVILPYKNVIVRQGEAISTFPVAFAQQYSVQYVYRVIDATTK